ncbi:MAG: alpha/beta fold hydrolase [Sinobacteraceae bacterium]|nr:alpha/beta fold hydrolase [Nevskiaceae bacterium]
MRQVWLGVITGLAALVIVIIAGTWFAAGKLSEPMPHNIGRPPLDLEASNVTMVSSAGHLVHGWLAHGVADHGVILLLHGLSADRRAMVPRAEYLHKLGYTVLMIDFQANGETRGANQTFGELESRDVAAAIQYLHYKLPDERLGILGVSLGAAAFVLADDREHVDAVVLDSIYPTLKEAIAERVRSHIGPLAAMVTPLLYVEAKSRLPLNPEQLRPIDKVGHLQAAVLVICGARDPVTTPAECQHVFAAASSPKELWQVQTAGHVDLYHFAPQEYERRTAAFFAQYLPQESGAPAAPTR